MNRQRLAERAMRRLAEARLQEEIVELWQAVVRRCLGKIERHRRLSREAWAAYEADVRAVVSTTPEQRDREWEAIERQIEQKLAEDRDGSST